MTVLSVLIGASFLGLTLAGDCSNGDPAIHVEASGEYCDYESQWDQYELQIQSQSNTGTDRLASGPIGYGNYTTRMKCGSGPGVNTNFYLYSYNRYNDQSAPWNEIDFEVLGPKIGGSSQVWTNYWVNFAQQDGQFVTVNADISQDFHEYTISVTEDNTIHWIIDGQELRSVNFGQYGDMVNSMQTNNMQVEFSIWAQQGDSWPDMGNIYDNPGPFPISGYWQNVTVNGQSAKKENLINRLHG